MEGAGVAAAAALLLEGYVQVWTDGFAVLLVVADAERVLDPLVLEKRSGRKDAKKQDLRRESGACRKSAKFIDRKVFRLGKNGGQGLGVFRESHAATVT